jgi:hypothetical protein
MVQSGQLTLGQEYAEAQKVFIFAAEKGRTLMSN